MVFLIVCIALFCAQASAQLSSFNQRGKATQEMTGGGLSIAHSSLPINSQVKVTNTANGKEVEATVTGRIPASSNRIADLSRGVWNELGLNPDTEIILSLSPTPRPRPDASGPVSTPPAALAANQPSPPVPSAAPSAASSAAPPTEPPSTESRPATPAQESRPASNDEYLALLRDLLLRDMIREDLYLALLRDLIRENNEAHQPVTTPSQSVVTVYPPYPPQSVITNQPIITPPPVVTNQPIVTTSPIVTSPPVVSTSPVVTTPPVISTSPIVTTPAPVNPSYPQVSATPLTPMLSLTPTAPPTPTVSPTPTPPVTPPNPGLAQQTAPSTSQDCYANSTPPPAKLEIIPRLPNPNSKEIYRLQVGSFCDPESANGLESRLKAAGFNVARELYNSMHRVLVTDVPAAMVEYAAQRLENMGIKQIWVRQ